MTSNTTIFATADEEKAEDYISMRKKLGDNVIAIRTSDQIEFLKEGEELAPWKSGSTFDWIVVIATAEKFVSPGRIAE
jgi:hypothetical protein